MGSSGKSLISLIAVLVPLSAPVFATVKILSVTPSVPSPQALGTPVTWTVNATDSNPGPLTFQFNVSYLKGPFSVAADFNVGTLNSGTWTSQPFGWSPTVVEGTHNIQVVIKDFASGETATRTVSFVLSSLVTGGNPVATATGNPLVALFSAPSCPAGSFMRVMFQQMGSAVVNKTNWHTCHPPFSMNREIAGLYPSTTYIMHSQTATGTTIVQGPNVNFTTGALPSTITFPTFSVNTAAGPTTDTTDSMILHSTLSFSGAVFLPVATDLAGNINWYYSVPDAAHSSLLTRPVTGGTLLTLQTGPVWNVTPQNAGGQLVREIDLAGNIIHETNVGIVQQQLLAKGYSDAGPCTVFPSPAPVGSSCLSTFHHDAIRLPNGFTAIIGEVEKIFPAGTQGDTSGLPVDVLGGSITVLDTNLQVVWFWESFQHAAGGTELDINRKAVLGETCGSSGGGCPSIFFLGPGIAPKAMDWMHTNSIYYSPQSGDFLLSSRHQDWVMKIDYNNGAGTGNILWRLGLNGDFTFNNINNDTYPWFSHQHDAGMENNGSGPLTLFDNGNTRVAAPPVGLGSGNSRGMALVLNEATMTATPVLSADLGVFAGALGSAQLLFNGNYFFQPGIPNSYDIEILPTSGTITGTQVLNVQGPVSYRSWQMQSLYNPPIT